MSVKKILPLVAMLSFFCAPSTFATHWKLFFYMDSSDTLSDMAIKNITDMMRGKPNDTVEFLLQVHAYAQAGLRYQITQDGLNFIEEIALTGDGKVDALQAVEWAFSNDNADHTLFIISNHGWGILDPCWDEQAKQWKVHDELANSCDIKRHHLEEYKEAHKKHRGFVFNNTSHTYLNNTDLIEVLGHVSKNLLHGKQLDIVAFDTCMGGMLEVAYQIAPYAQYLVGSQSCSLVDGFNYQDIVQYLNQALNPREMAIGMVKAFDSYYERNDDSGIYTHAALDLSHVYSVKNTLDVIVAQLLENRDAYESLIFNARKHSPRFCMWPMYTDLVAFCKIIDAQLTELEPSQEIVLLQTALQELYAKVHNFVVARCGGITTQGNAYGFAIYLPFAVIDNSYNQTVFAKECRWIQLLEYLCASKA